MLKQSLLYLFLCLLVATTSVQATVTLPKILGDNMVLQRGAAVAIWGQADAGENITVSFAGQQKKTVADGEGKWLVHLDAMKASDKPQSVTIQGNNTIILKNILIGEVWLCTGQSNMEYTMMKESKFAHALRSTGMDSIALKNERNPSIRLFLVKRDLTKPDGGGVNKGWNEAEGEALRSFSAAGYFFARHLFKELHVPIGMIASSVSGSAIEPWLSGEVKKDSLTQTVHIDESAPGKFYTGMIKPLAPFTLKGFLWYQGETNCFLKETTAYTFKFTHLINSWRKLWNEPDASFYFVQIAPFAYSKSKGKIALTETDLPAFRQAQAAALSVPHTGMIITTDLVDNIDDIHPTYKWEVGRRLALLALAHDYHKNVSYSGPVFKKATIKDGAVEISFTHAEHSLVASDNKPLDAFEVAGADGIFVPAAATIVADKVLVHSPSVSSPAWIRFAWNEAAQPNFFNRDNLPAAPFEVRIIETATAKKSQD
jgi:sialate O-acetylesterase